MRPDEGSLVRRRGAAKHSSCRPTCATPREECNDGTYTGIYGPERFSSEKPSLANMAFDDDSFDGKLVTFFKEWFEEAVIVLEKHKYHGSHRYHRSHGSSWIIYR